MLSVTKDSLRFLIKNELWALLNTEKYIKNKPVVEANLLIFSLKLDRLMKVKMVYNLSIKLKEVQFPESSFHQ